MTGRYPSAKSSSSPDERNEGWSAPRERDAREANEGLGEEIRSRSKKCGEIGVRGTLSPPPPEQKTAPANVQQLNSLTPSPEQLQRARELVVLTKSESKTSRYHYKMQTRRLYAIFLPVLCPVMSILGPRDPPLFLPATDCKGT